MMELQCGYEQILMSIEDEVNRRSLQIEIAVLKSERESMKQELLQTIRLEILEIENAVLKVERVSVKRELLEMHRCRIV